MRIKKAHGTNQYRLNHAKGLAQAILENTQRIEMLWQMSNAGEINKDLADNGIQGFIEETKRLTVEYVGYLEYREDMKEESR